MATTEGSEADFIDAIRGSHRTLTGLVTGLDEESLAAQSYDSEWTIA